jgi:fermentation-respiration switch protein FrsA (DUF1100 family)
MRYTLKIAAMSLAAGFAMLGGPATAQPADPVGDWHGALQTPQGNVTLIVTVSRADDGALKAEVENPDQAPGNKVPTSSMSVKDGQFTFEVARVKASFKGAWTPADQSWTGTFSQGMDMPLKLVRGLPPARPVIEGLDGNWAGSITRNDATLRLVLRVRTSERGTVAVLDSPDQMAMGLGVQDFARSGNKVTFRMALAGVHYEGALSDDGASIDGTWTATTTPATPVRFTRTAETAQAGPPKRPQLPVAPFPYTVEEVAFDNPEQAGVRLAGSLTLPKGKGPFPAAILITGSGMQDRDETLMGHKPFAVIADHLTRHGIAVLRFDDRGAGKSTGDYSVATSADLATDANSAFAFLKGRADIRGDAIGFIGHSEGGMIGPIAMASNKAVAYLVMLAGPGTALDQLLLSQRRLIGTTMGLSEAELNQAEPVMAAMFRAIATGKTQAEGLEAARAVLTPDAMAAIGMPKGANKELVVAQVSSPWFRYFLQYDPAPNLRAIRVPVLALNGSLDRQVPAAANLAAIKAAMNGNPDLTTRELPSLNHLFQTAKIGSLAEYAQIEETFAPVALDAMSDWINARFGRK